MKNKPFVIILAGVPMSGKSTWVKENYPDTLVISRDEILMEVANTRDYGFAYKNANHKVVDRLLTSRIMEASANDINVIIDMTNLTRKIRIRNLSYFSDNYLKKAIIFPVLEMDEYNKRNEFRKLNENKFIPYGVITSMITNFVLPTLDEGFDEIIKI